MMDDTLRLRADCDIETHKNKKENIQEVLLGNILETKSASNLPTTLYGSIMGSPKHSREPPSCPLKVNP